MLLTHVCLYIPFTLYREQWILEEMMGKMGKTHIAAGEIVWKHLKKQKNQHFELMRLLLGIGE